MTEIQRCSNCGKSHVCFGELPERWTCKRCGAKQDVVRRQDECADLQDILCVITDFLAAVQPLDRKIEAINALREAIHQVSPFKREPVDFIKWVPADFVEANDYNPNTVAPPEMQLLALSIESDGYTQPIVTWEDATRFEVVDGFHRNRVGKEVEAVKERLQGYLPVTIINAERQDRSDRIASTIRHNRARGKHGVQSMSDIVVELKRRNWSDKKIGKQLGMDPDEVLRLSQISGLAEMFQDREFSEAWEATDPFGVIEDDDLAIEREVG